MQKTRRWHLSWIRVTAIVAVAAAMAGCHHGAAPARPPAAITPSRAQPARVYWKGVGDIGWYEAEVVFAAADTAVTCKSYAGPRVRSSRSATAGTALWDQLLHLGILDLPDVHYTGPVMDGSPCYDVDVTFRLEGTKRTKRITTEVRGAQEGDPRYLRLLLSIGRCSYCQYPDTAPCRARRRPRPGNPIARPSLGVLEQFVQVPAKRRLRLSGSAGAIRDAVVARAGAALFAGAWVMG